MKVSEMIDQLMKFCPDNDVLFVDSWGDEHDFEMFQDNRDSGLVLIREVH